MQLDSLRIENYRCFDEVRIDFHEKLSVLVAPNGGGKTAVLDAAAVALSPCVGKTGTAYGKNFRSQDSRRNLVAAGSNGARAESPFREIVLKATGRIEGCSVSWKRQKKTEKGGTTVRDALCLTDYAQRLLKRLSDSSEAPNTVLPIIAHYGTGRLWGPQSFKVTEEGKPLVPRNQGYRSCLSSLSKYESFRTFFGAAYFSMLAGRIQQQDRGFPLPEQALLEESVRNVKNAAQIVLRPYGECWLEYESGRREIIIVDAKHQTKLGLDQQSDGVQVMLAMVGDIATRTSVLNPQFGAEAAKRTPGIVLIDEVDIHLHPSWQQRVLQSLGEAFPSIQFIVTTHSPQVLSTAPAHCIRKLAQDADGRWTAEKPPGQTEGVESGYAMTIAMDADPIPDIEKARWLKDYRALIEDGKAETTNACNLRAKLLDHFGPTHPEMLDCGRLIRFQAFKLKRTGPKES